MTTGSRSAWFFCLSMVFVFMQAADAETTKQTRAYVVMASGLRTGEMTVRTLSAGTREIHASFNDRGRGAVVMSLVHTNAALLPTRLTVRGVDYFKKPVDERFDRIGSRESWKTTVDEGNAHAPNAFYFPAEWSPEHLAMLVRAALRTPSHALALLPAGNATVEQITVRDIELEGRKQKATLYAIGGLDFHPMPVWLDASGELLLEGGAWFATTRVGLEAQIESLVAEQEQLLAVRQIARAKTLSEKPSTPIAFVGVSLFDAQARVMRAGTTVVVRSSRIETVGPDDSVIVPIDARRIDGHGKTLLPGLWDMHTHVSSNERGLMHLAAGVTTVRDLGDPMNELIERRNRFDSGELIGPHILLAGFIDGPGPLAGPIKVLASTPDEMRAAIGNYAAHGYVQIKLYSSLDPHLVPVATAEAHRLGLRISGHIPAGMTMREAVEDGYDEVQHMNFVMLNFMGPEINAKTNGMTRFTAVAEHGLELDLASKQVAEFVALLKQHDTVIDPTFSIFENHFMGRTGKPAPNLAAAIDRLPPVVRRGSFGAGLANNDAEAKRNAASFHRMLQMLQLLHTSGIRIVPGTDDMEGFTYDRELELHVQAGIAPLDVLYMATLGSARVMAQDKERGSVVAGKLADLVLIDGAPAERISEIRNVALVMKDGLMFDPAKLYGEIGVVPDARAGAQISKPVGAVVPSL